MRWKTDQLQAEHAGGPEDALEQEVMWEVLREMERYMAGYYLGR